MSVLIKSQMHVLPSMPDDLTAAFQLFQPVFLSAYKLQIPFELLVSTTKVKDRDGPDGADPRVVFTGFMGGYDLTGGWPAKDLNVMVERARHAMLAILAESYKHRMNELYPILMKVQELAAGMFLEQPITKAFDEYIELHATQFPMGRSPVTGVTRYVSGTAAANIIQSGIEIAPFIWSDELEARIENA